MWVGSELSWNVRHLMSVLSCRPQVALEEQTVVALTCRFQVAEEQLVLTLTCRPQLSFWPGPVLSCTCRVRIELRELRAAGGFANA